MECSVNHEGHEEHEERREKWPRVRLDDVCTIDAPIIDPRLPEYRDLPHVSGENIESGSGRLLPLRSAAQDGVSSGNYLFDGGVLLYSKLRPYLRKVAEANFRGVCSADMYPIRFDAKSVHLPFAKFALLTEEFTRYAIRESERARMPKLNREQLLRWEIPLPPLAEQKRIAARLARQLGAADRARAAAQARLAAAQTLPAAYLREVFEAAEHDTVRLDEIAEIQLGKMAHPDSRRGTSPFPYLRNANVQWGRFDLRQMAEMDFDEDERAKFSLHAGDLLVCEGGEPGRAAIWEGQITECYYQKAIFRIRPFDGVADSRFLMYRLWSGAHTGEFEDSNAVTTISHLPRVRLCQLKIPLPPLADQHRIAADLGEKLARADALVARCREELAAVEALPGALLREAFGGHNNGD